MNPPAHDHEPVLSWIRSWMAGDPPPEACLAPAGLPGLMETLRRNRLTGWLAHWVMQADVAERGPWPALYGLLTAHANVRLGVGCRLASVLEAGGIRCVMLRGPFESVRLYGDPACRVSADVDVLVSRGQREAALSAALRAGYRWVPNAGPAGYYRRQHYHWPLVHEGTAIRCDLHWAVANPYEPVRIDYAGILERAVEVQYGAFTWGAPSPEDALLLTAWHLGRETRENRQLALSENLAVVTAERGWLGYWLDLASAVRCHGSGLDWELLFERSRAGAISGDLAAGVVGIGRLFGAPVPEAVGELAVRLLRQQPGRSALPAVERYVSVRGWLDRPGVPGTLARFGVSGLFPPDEFFGHAAFPLRFWRRCVHVGRFVVRGFAGMLAHLAFGVCRGWTAASVSRAERVPAAVPAGEVSP